MWAGWHTVSLLMWLHWSWEDRMSMCWGRCALQLIVCLWRAIEFQLPPSTLTPLCLQCITLSTHVTCSLFLFACILMQLCVHLKQERELSSFSFSNSWWWHVNEDVSLSVYYSRHIQLHLSVDQILAKGPVKLLITMQFLFFSKKKKKRIIICRKKTQVKNNAHF